ncbi:hypothetical protein DSC45_02285 [Streptomyces sp. YIM 130001]|uniref:hypothetical protein n=1 Tax=Streptomyces sp. YIM 130001 TaxID=2259644 RepID=UPI000E656BB9|nr:hypothetical protein [Streptomyces sp. YIM 130001]RII20932.1 hypothetical protein DSC45_02285 [Streptomyces sp. YIM 130001]
MSLSERREDQVRQLLAGPLPAVPPGLAAAAAARGERRLRRQRALRRVMWLLLCLAVVAFTVWASVEQPWVRPPAETTPPLQGW